MAFSGMTGFARVAGEAEWGTWVWEGKSVNGKGLDLRLTVPSGFEAVDAGVRAHAAKLFERGSFQIGLRLEPAESNGGLVVNHAALKTLIAAYEAVDGNLVTGAALATLIASKGVVESGAAPMRDLAQNEALLARLIEDGQKLLGALQGQRRAEGEALSALLSGHLTQIATLTQSARAYAGVQSDAIAERYRERLRALDTEGAVSEERLAAEIAVLAAKADVTEELDRLEAHVGSGRDMIASGKAVGRGLGFLAQELNREANTLCSKSASLDLTNAGLALKSVIDQFKEQAANVE